RVIFKTETFKMLRTNSKEYKEESSYGECGLGVKSNPGYLSVKFDKKLTSGGGHGVRSGRKNTLDRTSLKDKEKELYITESYSDSKTPSFKGYTEREY